MRKLIKPFLLICLAFFLINCENSTPTPQVEPEIDTGEHDSFPPVDPAVVREKVIAYLLQHHNELENLLDNQSWEELPKPETQSLATYSYQSEDWRINITVLPANLIEIDGETIDEDTYDISVNYLSPPPYLHWLGLYTENTDIAETSYVNRAKTLETIAPEQIRDIAFQYIYDQHPTVESETDISWELLGTQAGPGESVTVYQSGDWSVTVRWSEYTGEFAVNGYYESVGEQYVEIEWSLRISADGSEITEESYRYFGGV